MGITAITIENFKGFKNPVRIELKPITLLFGPNSAGKSTVIQALHYAREIFERNNLDPDKTISGGDAINLGGFQNLVHRQLKQEKEIKLGFELDLSNETMPSYLDGEDYIEKGLVEDRVERICCDVVDEDGNRYVEGEEFLEQQNEIDYLIDIPTCVKTAAVTVTIRLNDESKEPFIATYQVSINGEPFAEIEMASDSQKAKLSFLEVFHPIFYSEKEWEIFIDVENKLLENRDSIENVFATNGIAKELEEIGLDKANFLSIFNKKSFHFGLWGFSEEKGFELFPENCDGSIGLLPKIFESSTSNGIDEFCQIRNGAKSVDLCHDSALPIWGKPIEPEGNQKIPHFYKNGLFVKTISSLIVGPGECIRKFLKETCYLGPLRELPSRDHRPNRSPDESRWAKGLAAYDILFKADDKFIKKINNWLTHEERLHSSYSVKVKKYRELEEDSPLTSALLQNQNLDNVKELWENLSSKRRLLFRDEKMNMDLAPQDIGVGISQVLPVIVAALNAESGIVAIEQPELHIHPAFQVALGDLFIEQIRQHPEVTFLLETHSEHLLLRLLRRIRETCENEAPESQNLGPDDLSIYFIEQGEDGVSCRSIKVDEGGDFIDRWPRGFFNERVKELY